MSNRKCCASLRGQGPHLPGCEHAPTIPRLSCSSELLELAREFGIRVTRRPLDHYQIHGQRLVNYWPESQNLTAYAANERHGERHVDPYRAIELAMMLPVGGRSTATRGMPLRLKDYPIGGEE